MFGTLNEMLKNAGYEVTVDTFKPYEKVSEFQVPWGSCVSVAPGQEYTSIVADTIQAHNFYRKNATVFNISDFDVRLKDYVYDWLKDNQDKCRVLPKPKFKRTAEGYIGIPENRMDSELECEAKYGLADVIFIIKYSTQFEKFTLQSNFDAINNMLPAQHSLYIAANKMLTANMRYGFKVSDEEKATMWDFFINELLPIAEFVPINIDEYDGVRISHKVYRDAFGIHEEVTSPCLGKNIKRYDDYMKKLQKWIDNGGYIKDDCFYLIHEDLKTKDGSLYLRPIKMV